MGEITVLFIYGRNYGFAHLWAKYAFNAASAFSLVSYLAFQYPLFGVLVPFPACPLIRH